MQASADSKDFNIVVSPLNVSSSTRWQTDRVLEFPPQ